MFMQKQLDCKHRLKVVRILEYHDPSGCFMVRITGRQKSSLVIETVDILQISHVIEIHEETHLMLAVRLLVNGI